MIQTAQRTKQINTVSPVSQPFEILPATSERLFETNAQDIFTLHQRIIFELKSDFSNFNSIKFHCKKKYRSKLNS